MPKPKYKWCRYCKWLCYADDYMGFCEATYKIKNINSRGENCEYYDYDENDTFYMIKAKMKERWSYQSF